MKPSKRVILSALGGWNDVMLLLWSSSPTVVGNTHNDIIVKEAFDLPAKVIGCIAFLVSCNLCVGIMLRTWPLE